MWHMGRNKLNKFRANITLGPIGARLLIHYEFCGRGTLLTAALMLWDQADDKTRSALTQIARQDFPDPKGLLPLFKQMLVVSDEIIQADFYAMLDAMKDDHNSGQKTTRTAPQHDQPTSRRKQG